MIRKVALVVCGLVSVLALSLGVMTMFRGISFWFDATNNNWLAEIQYGGLSLEHIWYEDVERRWPCSQWNTFPLVKYPSVRNDSCSDPFFQRQWEINWSQLPGLKLIRYRFRTTTTGSDFIFGHLAGLVFPVWLLIPLGVWPVRALARYRQRCSRRRRGLCFNCGYNLTGNVSGRCSECGQPITTPTPRGGFLFHLSSLHSNGRKYLKNKTCYTC